MDFTIIEAAIVEVFVQEVAKRNDSGNHGVKVRGWVAKISRSKYLKIGH